MNMQNDTHKQINRFGKRVAGVGFSENIKNVWDFSLNTLDFIERYGAGVSHFKLGTLNMCLVNQPEIIEKIYLQEAHQFQKPKLVTKLGATIFGQALTALDNAAWSERRKIFAKAFTPAAIDTLISESAEYLDSYYTHNQPSNCMDVEAYYRKLFIALYGHVFAGIELQGVSSALSEDIGVALQAYGKRLKIGVNIPEWVPLGMNRRLTSSMANIRTTLKPIITQRLKEAVASSAVIGVLKEALTSDMINIDQLMDELLVMITVGAHQSANAVAWLYYLLSKNSRYQALIAEETAYCNHDSWNYGKKENLKITTACLNESLRLYPPFYMIGRQAMNDCVVGGHSFRKGENVLVSAWLTQRDSRYFANPEAFIPERWLGTSSIPKFTYFPYGIGGRTCLAQLLLNRLLPIVVGKFLEKNVIQMSKPNNVVPQPGATLGIKEPLILKISASPY